MDEIALRDAAAAPVSELAHGRHALDSGGIIAAAESLQPFGERNRQREILGRVCGARNRILPQQLGDAGCEALGAGGRERA